MSIWKGLNAACHLTKLVLRYITENITMSLLSCLCVLVLFSGAFLVYNGIASEVSR